MEKRTITLIESSRGHIYDSNNEGNLYNATVCITPYATEQGNRIRSTLFTTEITLTSGLIETVRTLKDAQQRSTDDLERQIEGYKTLGRLSSHPLSVLAVYPPSSTAHTYDVNTLVQIGLGMYTSMLLRKDAENIRDWFNDHRGVLSRIKALFKGEPTYRPLESRETQTESL